MSDIPYTNYAPVKGTFARGGASTDGDPGFWASPYSHQSNGKDWTTPESLDAQYQYYLASVPQTNADAKAADKASFDKLSDKDKLARMTPDERAAYSISQFIDEMNKPLDLNDPGYKQFLQTSLNNADAANRGMGIGGGMAGRNLAQIGAQASNQYDLQRKGLAMGGMGLQQQQLARQDQNEMNKYMMHQDFTRKQEQSNASLAGLGGAVIGGVGGFFVGGPAGAMAGASGGYGFGQGIYSALNNGNSGGLGGIRNA